jgi:hypothetical protein
LDEKSVTVLHYIDSFVAANCTDRQDKLARIRQQIVNLIKEHEDYRNNFRQTLSDALFWGPIPIISLLDIVTSFI